MEKAVITYFFVADRNFSTDDDRRFFHQNSVYPRNRYPSLDPFRTCFSRSIL